MRERCGRRIEMVDEIAGERGGEGVAIERKEEIAHSREKRRLEGREGERKKSESDRKEG